MDGTCLCHTADHPARVSPYKLTNLLVTRELCDGRGDEDLAVVVVNQNVLQRMHEGFQFVTRQSVDIELDQKVHEKGCPS
jgi:hypothetical protein